MSPFEFALAKARLMKQGMSADEAEAFIKRENEAAIRAGT